MASNTTERRPIGKTYYNGELVTLVSRAKVLGREYYEIRFPNGKIRTVLASECSAENRKKGER